VVRRTIFAFHYLQSNHRSRQMDILELFTVIFTTLAGLVALHVAAFLTVRWMYPPQVAPQPQPQKSPLPARSFHGARATTQCSKG
jgi:hypothetical protein